jgi:hypothetical protein
MTRERLRLLRRIIMNKYGKFKALDVRECIDITSLRGIDSGYGTRICIDKREYIVVIAERVWNNERCRFELYSGYQDTFLNKNKYYGYQGQWNMIVPGDVFEIEETNTYDKVTIL